MKICFIWVENFRNFKSLGFNFSSSNKFSYDRENNELNVEQVQSLPADFFGQGIVDVTGIIGKNGSGKSNTIDLICKLLKGSKSSVKTNFCIITREGKKLVCYYSFDHKEAPKSHFQMTKKEYEGSINPLKVVYFSNVFDERRNDFDAEIADISVNKTSMKENRFKKDFISDFDKQVNFINSDLFQQLEINTPEKVQLTSRVWLNRSSRDQEQRLYGNHYEFIKDFQRFFRQRTRDIKPENRFVPIIRFSFFFEMLNSLISNRGTDTESTSQILMDFQNSFGDYQEKRTEEIALEFIKWLDFKMNEYSIEEFSNFSGGTSYSNGNYDTKKVRDKFDFIKDLNTLIKGISLEYESEGSRNRGLEYFSFDFNLDSSRIFISKYIGLFERNSLFDINWLGISSGHKAYLNIFASIFHELKNTRTPNILLCVDEGDLYLHPKWQIEFFDKLVTVLPKIYNGKIQIILTSHSPFLLSDLPKQCITIIDNAKIIDGVTLKRNTLGGNLYNLYSEPFFLGNKKTSDFAYKKIKSAIDMIESGNVKQKDRDAILKLNSLIGDEVIEFHINKQLGND